MSKCLSQIFSWKPHVVPVEKREMVGNVPSSVGIGGMAGMFGFVMCPVAEC